MKPVYEFRPLPRADGVEVFRYAGGKWVKDDGEYDLAFAVPHDCLAYFIDVGYQRNIIWRWLDQHWQGQNHKHPRSNPWHYMLAPGETEWGGDWGQYNHANYRAGREATSYVCGLRHCANGIHAEFAIGDPYIAAGLVRNAATKEVVRFPDVFNCMYCGEHVLAALASK